MAPAGLKVERLENACERALAINARSYASVKSILQNNLERRRRDGAADGTTDGPAIAHINIRGAVNFHAELSRAFHREVSHLRLWISDHAGVKA